MALVKKKYTEIRKKMQPGDIIAFGGTSTFSELIKVVTGSSVSHVGIVLQRKLVIGDEVQDGYFNEIMESASYNDFTGVMINRLSERLQDYEGELWWLPLSKAARKKLDYKAFFNFLMHQNRKKYDLSQAVTSALDAIDKVPIAGRATYNVEDFSRFFCSELATAGLEAGGVIKKINSSEVTPVDLCRFKLYDKDYFQFKGRKKIIGGYNQLNPESWGM